jgi:hypothetical protein
MEQETEIRVKAVGGADRGPAILIQLSGFTKYRFSPCPTKPLFARTSVSSDTEPGGDRDPGRPSTFKSEQNGLPPPSFQFSILPCDSQANLIHGNPEGSRPFLDKPDEKD